jgi:hypothetical protein
MDWKDRRAQEIIAAIRQVLLRDWDPIGVQDEPNAQDEYDGYVGRIYRVLARGASELEVAEELAAIERRMSFQTKPSALLPVAAKLKALDVRLGEEQGSA